MDYNNYKGYKSLPFFQQSEIIYDFTTEFVGKYIAYNSRTKDQMTQAARSGKQNIAEGCMASGTSKKTELKLVGIARASLEELLVDYQDYLRQHNLPLWGKEHPKTLEVRALARLKDKSYKTYSTYFESGSPEIAANTAVCLIHQANYLLDQQLRALDKAFLENGGFTERLYKMRQQQRSQ